MGGRVASQTPTGCVTASRIPTAATVVRVEEGVEVKRDTRLCRRKRVLLTVRVCVAVAGDGEGMRDRNLDTALVCSSPGFGSVTSGCHETAGGLQGFAPGLKRAQEASLETVGGQAGSLKGFRSL